MTTHTTPRSWAQHLAGPAAGAGAHPPTLTLAEAERVQRHRDQLMAALRAQDRVALVSAKQQVLEAAFCPRSDPSPVGVQDSPAMRRALRDLSWCMAALLLPRSPGH
ncbi:hypothetical protein [Acidovorax sp. ACV01]|uniref:hypothetical protein n=1 Tax=Acidovorax sp. ACV01 TaxID=2769311 RepID=UPI001CE1EAF7|nr:hypothetical protein [Acidovorax sp. ACV01]